MNKVIAGAVAGLALGAFSAVSALDLSVGGGGFFASDFGGGLEYSLSMPPVGSVEVTSKMPYYGGGAYLFFDVTYAEVSVGYFLGGGEWAAEMKATVMGETETESSKADASFSALNLGLLLKYPVPLSDNMILFPAVGIDYLLVLAGENKAEGETQKWDGKDSVPKAGDFSAPIFKFGVGLDVAVSGQLYVRPELLYGIRMANKAENDAVKEIKDELGGLGSTKTRLGHGLTVKVGLGYKL